MYRTLYLNVVRAQEKALDVCHSLVKDGNHNFEKKSVGTKALAEPTKDVV